jgi:N-acetyl-anhydromuramyl-L-alanine amidase AmpD
MSFTSDYPGAIVVEANNYGFVQDGQPVYNRPKSWCLHTPEEEADEYPATPYYFENTNRMASTHYFVSWLGFVFQMVPEIHGAYANGVRNKAYPPWADPTVNLNLQTLSVEIEGYAATIHQTMKRGGPQWNALIELLAHRCLEFNLNPVDMIGHYQIADNRTDPGSLNINKVITDVENKIDEWTRKDDDDMMVTFYREDGTREVWERIGGTLEHIENGVVFDAIKAALRDTGQEYRTINLPAGHPLFSKLEKHTRPNV